MEKQSSQKLYVGFLIVFLGLFSGAGFAVENVTVDTVALGKKIEDLIQEKLPNTPVGIVVKNPQYDQILYERRGKEAFLPASVAKIFSAAASLFALGPEFKFETRLKYDPNLLKQGKLAGDVYLEFSGDPSLEIQDLENLLKTLKSQGIQQIQGNVIIDDAAFVTPNYAEGWVWNSLPWYFSAPVTTIILNENQLKLELISNPVLGKKAELKIVEGSFFPFPFKQDVLSVTEQEANETCQITVNMSEQNNLSMTGCWPQKEKPESLKVAVQNPRLLASKVIEKNLRQLGIGLSGKIVSGKTPNALHVQQVHHSEPLSELLKQMLQESTNIYAESLTKTLGRKTFGQGSFQAGVRAITAILTQEAGLDFKQIRLQDGSGASRYNGIPPAQLVQILSVLNKNEKIGTLFKQLLPVYGESGTLKEKNTLPMLKGRLRAKTGTMNNTRTLCGFIITENNQELIFAMMINNAIADKDNISDFEDKFCEILAKTPIFDSRHP